MPASVRPAIVPKTDGSVRASQNFVVFEVLNDRPEARVLLVGEYRDGFVRAVAIFRLRERRCVYDNPRIATALCIPV
jgi:anthranilate 1,2-dioxygenase small subunit